MIESFTDGRVRLRSTLTADRELAELLSSGLMKINGVLKVEINPRTNGALLEYDKKRLPRSLLRQAAPLLSRIDDLERLPNTERAAKLKGILDELSKIIEDIKK
ncbi:MAG: hypothetical protein LBS53_00280 [Synergistaceae bacterium]|jgi:hypothetical protein|nr:hypothetical protein [Synergistaceae bacterium]